MSEPSTLHKTEQALYDVAEAQAGYFASAQARAAGYSQRQLTFYVHAGRFTRVAWGVYRLTQFPASRHEDLYAAQLRCGPASVISHDSALAYFELSDVLPARVHLTVPRTASRRQQSFQLHTSRLEPGDVTLHAGLRLTTVARTIYDAASSGIADELVIQSVRESIRRGLVPRDELLPYLSNRGGRARRLVSEALEDWEA